MGDLATQGSGCIACHLGCASLAGPQGSRVVSWLKVIDTLMRTTAALSARERGGPGSRESPRASGSSAVNALAPGALIRRVASARCQPRTPPERDRLTLWLHLKRRQPKRT